MIVSTWGFGVVRAETMTAPQAVIAEICDLATVATGEKFVPQFAESYRDLAATLKSGKTGLAWMPPIPAVELEDNGAAFVLALPARKGQATYHSALITRKGAAKSLEECKGRSIVWVDQESASGYVIPRLHLASLGIDAGTFFSREIFAKTHMGVVDAVLAGRADVGATYCNFEPGSKNLANAAWTDFDGNNARAIEMLSSTGAIPNDAIVGTSKLPLPLRASVTRFLLELSPRGKQLFEQFLRATEFRVSRPGHFEPLKHMVRMARVRGYSIPPPGK